MGRICSAVLIKALRRIPELWGRRKPGGEAARLFTLGRLEIVYPEVRRALYKGT
jgi:hypothetical protein